MLTPPRQGGGDGRKSHTWPPPSTYLKKCGNGCPSSPREPQIVNCEFATSSASFLPPCYVMYSRQRFGPVWVSFRVWTDPYSSQPAALHPLFLSNFSLGSCFVKERKCVTKVFTTVAFPDIPRFSKPHFKRETVESRSLRGVVVVAANGNPVSPSFFWAGEGRKVFGVGKKMQQGFTVRSSPSPSHTHTRPKKKGKTHYFPRRAITGLLG